MKNILTLAFVTIASASFAATWTEVGDAGYLASTAQATGTLHASLTSITGTRAGATANERADLYLIEIKDANSFIASTDAADGGAATFDTRLMLFRLDGTGVVFNDDTPAGVGPSRINNSTSLITAGYYLLGIDAYSGSAGPSSAGGLIWGLGSPWTTIKAPDGAGAAGALTGWGTGAGGGTGTYTIALTGASAVPEPTTMAALGLGLAAVVRRRRNKK
ncbi:MAG: PEP-CTERM sorting domain-containing protein [Chthonomonas sp.]|nr:PEP-CTERM sorting domain-containing protein [Chthonomonas sp.]